MATPRTDYPDDFERQAWECKVLSEMRCINCDALHGDPYITARGKRARKVVTAAHVHHDPRSRKPRLVCLCRECHRSYDARCS
jgi:hypothetical protein